MLACELLELGFAPALIVSLIDSQWGRLKKIVAAAEDAAERDPGPADVILHISSAHLLGGALSDALPAVNSCTLGRLPDHMAMLMAMQPDDPLPPRGMIVNLSMRLRSFSPGIWPRVYELTAQGPHRPACEQGRFGPPHHEHQRPSKLD